MTYQQQDQVVRSRRFPVQHTQEVVTSSAAQIMSSLIGPLYSADSHHTH